MTDNDLKQLILDSLPAGGEPMDWLQLQEATNIGNVFRLHELVWGLVEAAQVAVHKFDSNPEYCGESIRKASKLWLRRHDAWTGEDELFHLVSLRV